MTLPLAYDLWAQLPIAAEPVPITMGTVKQINWAEAIRDRRIYIAPPELRPVLNAVVDSQPAPQI
jgi:hypothetical protein